jgi:hypothetical protein
MEVANEYLNFLHILELRENHARATTTALKYKPHPPFCGSVGDSGIEATNSTEQVPKEYLRC